jgi:hypothetical protein
MLERTRSGNSVIEAAAGRLTLNSPSPKMFVTTRCRCPHCQGTGLARPPIDGKALILATVAGFGLLSFTSGELLAHARAVGGRLLTLLDGQNANTVGWALKRIAGVEVDGYRLERQGQDRNRVALWRVVALPVL